MLLAHNRNASSISFMNCNCSKTISIVLESTSMTLCFLLSMQVAADPWLYRCCLDAHIPGSSSSMATGCAVKALLMSVCRGVRGRRLSARMMISWTFPAIMRLPRIQKTYLLRLEHTCLLQLGAYISSTSSSEIREGGAGIYFRDFWKRTT